MSNVTQHLNLSSESINGTARAQAFAATEQLQSEPTAAISYSSNGSVFILGKDDVARHAAFELAKHSSLVCTLVTIDATSNASHIKLEVIPENAQPGQHAELSASIQGEIAAVDGYLGHFDLLLKTPQELTSFRDIVGKNRGRIDIVLDMSGTGLISSEVKPPGYFVVIDNHGDKDSGNDSGSGLEKALQEIPELVGEFEKPKYFNYDPNICAHGRSNITACTRCIDACPTDAITSSGNEISVNPNLCQGAGSCATACPTGAITYSYPQLSDSLRYLHSLLTSYSQCGGEQAVILFYDAASGRETLEKNADRLAENIIPVEIEELGSVGLDGWLSCLAYGARMVALLSTPQVPPSVLKELKTQISYAEAILKGMGYSHNLIQLVDDLDEIDDVLATSQSLQDLPVAEFIDTDNEGYNKRKVIHAAVDHLYQHAIKPRPLVSLPMGAPFGQVWVDEQRCTLCMSCVWQCPADALIAGGNQPQLKFVENDCVQCGLCARSCPEEAIGPSPRYLYDKEKRQSPRVINEEQPFECIRCGKAFASRSVIDKMTSKLKAHAMFQGDALKRIQMCEDCRVKDIYEAERKLHKENA